ncbi:MAG: sulfatase-like hydrolase/transferase [Prolixibacteraceae bacterium]
MISKLILTIPSLLCTLPLFSSPAITKAEKPNVLFILADDLGYGDLSCQGGKDIHTPNIDQLFMTGVRFSKFYASCTVCSPTRASLMTGRYPDMVGVPGLVRGNKADNWGYLLPSAVTLPEMLKKAGYQTALIGKWNLGLETPNLPNERGFDFFHGFLSDMMDDYYTHLREGVNYMRMNKTEISPQGHATNIFTDWAINYVDEKSKEKDPFFLYLAYNAPHFPIQPPEEWLEKVKKREGNIDEKRAKNIALVEHLDENIGRVIDALKKNGQYENTIIFFSSDNGGYLPVGASNGDLRGGKQEFFEGGIKVPTCMVWEGTLKKGVYDKLALTMDFFPTICSIAGINVNHTIDGINLMPGILGKSAGEENNRIIYFMRREGGNYGGMSYYAIRKGEYKLLQNTPFENFQLFNIEADPLEKNPLDINLPQFKALKSDLAQHIRISGAIPWEKPGTN